MVCSHFKHELMILTNNSEQNTTQLYISIRNIYKGQEIFTRGIGAKMKVIGI